MATVPEPDRVEQSDHRHVYVWEGLAVTIALERFAEERTGLKSELHVASTEGAHPQVLFDGNYNLSSPTGQKQIVTKLKTRTPEEEIPWEFLLDLVALRSKERYRRGEEVSDLFDPIDAQQSRYLLPPFIEDGAINGFHGEGGSLKSILALAAGLSVASGIPILGAVPIRACPVLYMDWEAKKEDHQERVQAIWAGLETTLDPPRTFIRHQRQVASLKESATAAARVIQDLGAGLVIIDSVSMARGGSSKEDDTTIAFHRAARSLNVPVLLIDHVSKEAIQNDDLRFAIGTVVSTNGVRRSWSVETQQEEDSPDATVLIENHKHNNGSRAGRYAFRFHFESHRDERGDEHLDRVTITPTEFRDAVQASGALHRLTNQDKIVTALREAGRSLSVQEIREYLGEQGLAVSEGTIRTTLNRNDHTFAGSGHGGGWKLAEWDR